MILLSSVVAAYTAVERLLHPQPVSHLWAVAGAGLIGFLGNEWVARYRIRVGGQSAPLRWSRTGCTLARTASPASQSSSAPAAWLLGCPGPTRSWAW